MFSLFGTSANAQCTDCGIVIHTSGVYDSSIHDYRWKKGAPDLKIYYKDSFAIIALMKTFSISNVDAATERINREFDFEVDTKLIFVDLRSRKFLRPPPFSEDTLYENILPATFYEYPSFSKDSFFTMKYNSLDTALRRANVFFFGTFKGKNSLLKLNDSAVFIADTIMHEVVYKRKRGFLTNEKKGDPIEFERITYSRCDIKDYIPMLLLKNQTDSHGCALVRFDFHMLKPNENRWLSQTYQFSLGKLTAEEIAVFEAWKKNARDNPIK